MENVNWGRMECDEKLRIYEKERFLTDSAFTESLLEQIEGIVEI